MSNNPTPASPPPYAAASSAAAPKQGGSSLLYVLLGVLLVVVGWYGYDQFVAKRSTIAADEAIRNLADERNKQSITGPDGRKMSEGRVISDDIQKLLGRPPYAIDKQKEYTVETYWWYSMPHRNYITVLYFGNEPRRYNTHYINRAPPPEDLPIDLDLPPASASESDTPSVTADAPGEGDSGAPAPAPGGDETSDVTPEKGAAETKAAETEATPEPAPAKNDEAEKGAEKEASPAAP